jgi:hypothetical protein
MSDKRWLFGLVLATWNIGRWGRLDVQNLGEARLYAVGMNKEGPGPGKKKPCRDVAPERASDWRGGRGGGDSSG